MAIHMFNALVYLPENMHIDLISFDEKNETIY